MGGGKLYQVEPGVDAKGVLGSPDKLHAIEKPEILQERLWREVYPARRYVYGEQKIMPGWFSGSTGWKEDGDDLVAEAPSGQSLQLYYASEGNGALTNLIWDGYPTEVAQAIRTKEP